MVWFYLLSRISFGGSVYNVHLSPEFEIHLNFSEMPNEGFCCQRWSTVLDLGVVFVHLTRTTIPSSHKLFPPFNKLHSDISCSEACSGNVNMRRSLGEQVLWGNPISVASDEWHVTSLVVFKGLCVLVSTLLRCNWFSLKNVYCLYILMTFDLTIFS